jgi:hypothetical protein
MRRLSYRLALPTLILVASASWTQGPVKPQPQEQKNTTLTAQQKSLLQGTAASDVRVQGVLGASQPRVMVRETEVDKYEALAYLRGETDKLPTHRTSILMLNSQTNRAVHVLMSVEKNSVESVREIPPADVPLFPEEAAEALALATANPDVRSAVGSRLRQFVIVTSGSDAGIPLAAEALRVRSVAPSDPCTLDRCLDLIFRTESGYLPLRATVDLTQHTVVLNKAQHMKGKHQ